MLDIDPHLERKKLILEAHIFSFNKNLYDKRIKIILIKFIRGEKKFNNIIELKKQIQKRYKRCKVNNMAENNLNLPKTSFSMKANLPSKEPKILETWDKIKLYERLRKKSEGKTKFVLHDGPPYANGHIHMGTALNKILKTLL